MQNYNIYLNTESEKYDFLTLARSAGAIVTGVSGCGTGYYIQIQATPTQAHIINGLLGGDCMIYAVLAVIYLPLYVIFNLTKLYRK